MARKPGERWNCEACGTPLVGAQSSSNPKSVMPIKLEPVENGNILLQQIGGTIVGFVIGNVMVRGALQDAGVVMRISHFADCPGKERFQREQ